MEPYCIGFLFERLYEYYDQNHSWHLESRDYNQWGVDMAKFFDGYVPDGDRIMEKRRRLGKVYDVYKMLQNHTGLGCDPITKTFTCSEELRSISVRQHVRFISFVVPKIVNKLKFFQVQTSNNFHVLLEKP